MSSASFLPALAFLAATSAANPPSHHLPKNFGHVAPGIYRGAQPVKREFDGLKEMGIKTILKLNTHARQAEREACQRLGIDLVEVPLNARTVGRPETCPDVTKAYAVLIDPNRRPVFVHCQHGKDRTGFLIGLYREKMDGWSFPKVKEEAVRYGHNTLSQLVQPQILKVLEAGFASCPLVAATGAGRK